MYLLPNNQYIPSSFAKCRHNINYSLIIQLNMNDIIVDHQKQPVSVLYLLISKKKNTIIWAKWNFSLSVSSSHKPTPYIVNRERVCDFWDIACISFCIFFPHSHLYQTSWICQSANRCHILSAGTNKLKLRWQVCTRGAGENVKVSRAHSFLMNLAAKSRFPTPPGRRSSSWMLLVT